MCQEKNVTSWIGKYWDVQGDGGNEKIDGRAENRIPTSVFYIMYEILSKLNNYRSQGHGRFTDWSCSQRCWTRNRKYSSKQATKISIIMHHAYYLGQKRIK